MELANVKERIFNGFAPFRVNCLSHFGRENKSFKVFKVRGNKLLLESSAVYLKIF